jgi:Golgi nucleoside diphosphatase
MENEEEGNYETITMAELWATIGKAAGASDERVADLVKRMMSIDNDNNNEENDNDEL